MPRALAAVGAALIASSMILGCGSGGGGCRELCRSWEPTLEEQLEVQLGCSETRFASAGTCAACVWVFKRDFAVEVGDLGDTCREFFGGSGDLCEGVSCSGHGSCRAGATGASCDCDDGYRAEGPDCLVVP
jgi:hypothetical protein